MAFIPTAGVAQVDLIQMIDNQRCENVLHYKQAGATDYNTDKLIDLGTALIAYFNLTSVKGLYPSTWSLIEVRCTDMSEQFGPAVSVAAGLPIVGTRAGAQLPNNCALVLTKRSTIRGRNFRGRMYFAPLVEADVTGNVVSSAVVTSILGNLAGLLDITDADTVHHFLNVVSTRFNNQDRVAGIATQVFSLTSDGVVDSQRRRLPGRGN